MARRKVLALDLAALLPSWELALRAERKSPATLKVYGDGVRAFLRWCAEHGHTPALDRDLMKNFVADLLDAGAEPSTARSRQLAMRRFSAWLEEEGEIDHDPLLGLKAPKLDTKVTESLTDEELRRLIKACAGSDGLSIAKVVKLLRPLRSATITINGATQTFPPEFPTPNARSSPIWASSLGY